MCVCVRSVQVLHQSGILSQYLVQVHVHQWGLVLLATKIRERKKTIDHKVVSALVFSSYRPFQSSDTAVKCTSLERNCNYIRYYARYTEILVFMSPTYTDSVVKSPIINYITIEIVYKNPYIIIKL